MSQLTLASIDSSLVEQISAKNNEPDWLKEYRKNSLSVYHDLPQEVSPLYNKYTDARRMNPEQVALSIDSDSSIPDFLTKRLDEIKNETSIVQIGSNIYSTNVQDELKSKGLIISSLDDALQNYSELIQNSLEDSNSKEDKYTALNNAAFNSGIFVYIPQNITIDKPIHLISCLSVDGMST
ncbi:MAG: Fe-S cluster assembly protein SufD, partial [Candidatus Nitrosopelagicus sp.]|nr:Fe-S cluster assembly protein SufD [Candidatus Nitrosopelagicus sp.]